MMTPHDLARITRDWNAGYYANDNWSPYSDDEGLDQWIAETRKSVIVWIAYIAAVLVMMVVAFHVGRGQ